ncbi:tRNA (adenosine(37)-N6)-threonylcarbamoyltransferase complex ATPase subunit type 1 TsaE [Arenibacter sp. GZD96]|uniref:tRNA (adenosine(37)-N6)-threonylcarbamoyltransferase complex ATPase subunit type 1 TsaE n=1 Tax=Aurantibrevibacter litoralis TaxID=3106030 RepID=UPI002AFEAB17|nr:tRNA (adenosine(37)-N6)-threonylcarbamoyltransferase complex ATPase subunit type 1 TsaE [Arenibacter sp. GZD-96]MEA1785288.1 tRNA (adenosine(37)-N6)-threonylcarbamoyltransferase complex ATPase subunit type 1 TsaE [Arenibacter sp. GZD-96]
MPTLTYTEKDLPKVVTELIARVPSKVLAFHGAMGAGKTTLIKALVKELGGAGNANSPTFGLVNEYHCTDGTLLGYHFDFYRLKNEMEALDMGLEEYLDQKAWVFMEWPEKIASLLPVETTSIYIEIIDPKLRTISW